MILMKPKGQHDSINVEFALIEQQPQYPPSEQLLDTPPCLTGALSSRSAMVIVRSPALLTLPICRKYSLLRIGMVGRN